jgi:hypothetical protein
LRKTTLLGECADQAREAGFSVCVAREAGFERDWAFGVGRQVLEGLLLKRASRRAPRRRAQQLGGDLAFRTHGGEAHQLPRWLPCQRPAEEYRVLGSVRIG